MAVNNNLLFIELACKLLIILILIKCRACCIVNTVLTGSIQKWLIVFKIQKAKILTACIYWHQKAQCNVSLHLSLTLKLDKWSINEFPQGNPCVLNPANTIIKRLAKKQLSVFFRRVNSKSTSLIRFYPFTFYSVYR